MKKIIVILLLSVILILSFSIEASAHTYIDVWNTNSMYEDWDITQEKASLPPNGYNFPKNCFDFEKGISDKDFTADKIEKIHLKKEAVWSDNTNRVFDIARTIAPDTYDKKFDDLPIIGRYERGGFMGQHQGSYTDYYSEDTGWQLIEEDTLTDQMWGRLVGDLRDEGATLSRKDKISFNDYYGKIEFEYNPKIKVGEWTLGTSENPRNYHAEYVVMYKARYNIHFSISNVKFENNKIFMDIDGEESYSYKIRTDINHNFDYNTEEAEKLYNEEWAKYVDFRTKTEKTVTAEETKSTFALKGVRGEFVLYDVKGSDDKNVIFKVEENGIKLMFLVDGIIRPDTDTPPTVIEIENDASSEAGEVDVSIPGGVIISVISGGIAVAVAAAMGDGDGTDEKKKRYKMYVAKDFGDAIRKGDPPVIVKARIAEIDENGNEIDRDDLTKLITASGSGLTVCSLMVSGRYVVAKVEANPEDNDTRGELTFILESKEASFRNTVVFRLVGDPYLQFVEDGDEAGTIHHLGNSTSFEAIGGDGCTYKLRFMIVDATEEPKGFKYDPQDNFEIKFEPAGTKYTYWAVVKNNTPVIENKEGFTKSKNYLVNIEAVYDDKENPYGTIKGYMYPEGLSVDTDAELDETNQIPSAKVKAYEKEYAGDFDAKFAHIRFFYTLAIKTETGAKLIKVKNAGMKFEKMVGSTSRDKCIADKYLMNENYKMTIDGDNEGSFEPMTMLWEPNDGVGIQMYIPAECNFEGKKYEVKVYIRLLGKPSDPMEQWNAEHEKLIYRIKKYVPQEHWHEYLDKIKRISEEPRKSVYELRLMSKDIVRAYIQYWEQQGKDAQWWANAWDWMVYGAEWTKWIGDCAFSMLVNLYAGPLADAILSPAKDVFAAFVGEVGVNIVWGTKFNIENLECFAAIRTAGDNIVGNWASDGVKSILESGSSWKSKVGMISGALAAYLVYLSASNYLKQLNEDPENASLWKSIADGFKDLTINFLKGCISALMGKWLKSESFQKNIGSKIQKYICDKAGGGKMPEALKDVEMDWLDDKGELVFFKAAEVVENYLASLCGEGAAKIIENPTLGFKMNEKAEITYTFTVTWWDKAPFPVELNITKILSNTSCDIFGWLYEQLCGDIPVASNVLNIPKDPPLPGDVTFNE